MILVQVPSFRSPAFLRLSLHCHRFPAESITYSVCHFPRRLSFCDVGEILRCVVGLSATRLSENGDSSSVSPMLNDLAADLIDPATHGA